MTPQRPARGGVNGSAPRRSAEPVLVVGGDSSAREMVTRTVSGIGHPVETVASAAEARARLVLQEFSLAICDLRMHGDAGISLVRWIRSEHPDVAVLIAGEADDLATAELTLAARAHGYVSRPLTRSELTLNVDAALRRRKVEIENRTFQSLLERRFDGLVARLPAIVYLWEAGREGRCYYVSPAISDVLGYAPEQWLADPRLWMRRLHPEDRERVVAEETRSREDGTDLSCEYRMLAQGGRVVWIRDEATMITDGGIPDHLEGVMYDITREKEAQASLRRSHEETIRRLSRAAELRDDDTGAHIERVSLYCELIAQRLGLDPDMREQLRIASPMHDIGKIGIPDSILLKPGPLDPAERAAMERHAEIGHRILAGSGAELLDLAATIAWTHHERFDGGGYPQGLAGEAIPLAGRIAAVADVFDALTSDRAYRGAVPFHEAIAQLRSGRGSQFDARVLDAFLEGAGEIRAIMQGHSGAVSVVR